MERTSLVAVLTMLLVTLPVIPVNGQDWPTSIPDSRRILAGETTEPTTLFSPLRASTTMFMLTGTTSEKTVDARIGWWQGNNVSLVFKASGPIDKSTGGGVFADLDGLREAATAGFAFSRRFWNPTADNDKVKSLCKDLGIDPSTGKCRRTFIVTNHPDQVAKFDSYVNIGNPLIVGASLEVGRQAFEFVDTLTLEKMESTETVVGVKAGFGKVLTRRRIWLGALYRYERSFRAGPKTELCRSVGTGPTLRCDVTVVGAPTELKRSIVTGEVRHFVSDGFAINLKVHVDLTEEIVGVEIPLYFLGAEGKGLTGGVSLGYKSDRDSFVVQFFVGPALGYSVF